MDEHHEIPHGSIPGLPSGVSGMLLRIVLDAIEKAGYKKLADAIRNLPTMASDTLAKLIKFVFGLIARGQPINDKAIKEIKKIVGPELNTTALQESPRPDTSHVSASVQPSLLDLYGRVFGIVCAAMGETRLSIALCGFAHDSQCISYWRLTDADAAPHFSLYDNYLSPSGVEVYIIDGFDNSPKELAALNNAIRRDEVPRSLTDVDDNDSVMLLRRVYEFKIETRGLLPNREELKKKPDPFKVHNYDLPQSRDIRFSQGASPLPEMLESLTEAIREQESYRIALQNAVTPPK